MNDIKRKGKERIYIKQMGKKKGKQTLYEIEKYSRIVSELNLTVQHVVSSAMIL